MRLQSRDDAAGLLAGWLGGGQAKIALKVDDEPALLALKAAAQAAELPVHVVTWPSACRVARGRSPYSMPMRGQGP